MREFLDEVELEIRRQDEVIEAFRRALDECPPDVRFDVDLEDALPPAPTRAMAGPHPGVRA